MAVTEGYYHYDCDVSGCANEAYAQPDSESADQFGTMHYIDGEGVERSHTLCSAHMTVWRAMLKAWDAAVSGYLTSGENTLRSSADVDAANKALADMTKSRDTWWNNYQQVKAEYDAYRAAHPDTADGGAE